MLMRSFFLAVFISLALNFDLVLAHTYLKGLENSPLIVANHDLCDNSLRESVYELLTRAHSSILIFSFTFSDSKVLEIVNEKAQEGIDVHLVIDRDHISEFKERLHPSVRLETRSCGEGHMHHKILVVDEEYVWLGSANFTNGGFNCAKNLAICFISKSIATKLHKEAIDSTSSQQRTGTTPLVSSYGNQLLEVYLLPHNDPKNPRPVETTMNEVGKQKLVSFIDNALHHIKICVDALTYENLSQALINAARRGVQIDVAVGDTTTKAVKMLSQAGIKVKQAKNLHYKFMVVDHKILVNGSPNFSMNAFTRSDESFIVLHDLTQEQLKTLEPSLKAAELPIDLHVNVMQSNHSEQLKIIPSKGAHDNVELINKTIAALRNETNKTPNSKEHQRLITIAQRLTADLVQAIPRMQTMKVPGCLSVQRRQLPL